YWGRVSLSCTETRPLSGLNRHQPEARASGASRQPPARDDWNRRAAVGEADATAEEQQDFLFGRREARVAEPRFARDVAEIKHPGVFEEELALLGKEQAELRQVHLLLVRFRL